MPHKSVKLTNKTLRNLFQARNISEKLKLGNIIYTKRLNKTIRSLPSQVAKKMTSGFRTIGLAGGKQKTRKQRKQRKTRRHR